MRVFLWSSGVHPIIESILVDPPEGIDICSNIDISRLTSYGLNYDGNERRRTFESLADRTLYSLGAPRSIPVFSDSDLVHTVSGVVPICPNPWMATIEAPSSFYGLNDDWCLSTRRRLLLRKILESRSCKRVTCFSEAARTVFLRDLFSGCPKSEENEILGKTETLYPAVNPRRFVQSHGSRDAPFRVLFIGNHFFDKGGRELHRAVSELVPRYDVQLDMIARAPAHHDIAFQEFVRLNSQNWVKWHTNGVARRRILEEFYPQADLFVMCSYIDLFGYVILEAMASGLPVITANVFAQSELVEHGVNGFLVDPVITAFDRRTGARTTSSVSEYRNCVMNASLFKRTVSQLKELIALLIEDDKLRTQMARNSLEKTTDGVFGVAHRNARLREMYFDAIL